MRKIKLLCPAKINLGLKILSKRSDQYHNLYTIFQAISLYDELELEIVQQKKDIFSCNLANLQFDENNTIKKALALLRGSYHIPCHFKINLLKRIPAGGGLGGGSSNAAALIEGIDQLLKLELSIDQKTALGSKIGMDVPFFFLNKPAIGSQRGEKLTPIEIFNFKEKIILAIPDFPISTKEIYSAYNFPLTKTNFFIKIESLLREGVRSIDFQEVLGLIENDLEKVALKKYPQLREIEKMFMQEGAKMTLMSGSGSTIFSLFKPESLNFNSLETLAQQNNYQLIECYPIDKGCIRLD